MSLWLLVLAGCVFDRTDWFRERNEALCRLYVECFGTFDDRDACLADLDAFDDPACPDFSAGAAQTCVDALRTQADDCPQVDIADWEIPSPCALVCDAGADVARTLPNPPPVPTRGIP
jgi:hypothetical protein